MTKASSINDSGHAALCLEKLVAQIWAILPLSRSFPATLSIPKAYAIDLD